MQKTALAKLGFVAASGVSFLFSVYLWFTGNREAGLFRLGNLEGQLDCRVTKRDDRPAVEFTWEGHDESEHAFGRGWAMAEGDELEGMLYFHLGDETGFSGRRVKPKVKPERR